MAEPKEILYKNWIKAGLGLLYVKEGIQDFIVDEINNFHSRVLGKLPGVDRCTIHSIQNVLRCPTRGICSGRPCGFHDNTDPGKAYTPCLICEAIREEIEKAHRHRPPSYKNTTSQQWCTNSWELAKCFMAATGYFDKNTADDTDLSGLISVILNNEAFQTQITENLGLTGNKFEKVRTARNDIMHNAKFETPTTDLNSYFNILNDVLNDSKHLHGLTKVKDAKDKLQKLQNNLITITTEDEQRVREESLKALERKKEEIFKEIDQKKQEFDQDIDKRTEEIAQKLEEKVVYKITDAVKRQLEEPADKDYEKRRDQLRTELMDYYKETGCSTTAVPALMDGEEVHINKIFVMPSMSFRENMATGRENRNAMPGITTIHELFQKDRQSIRRVCISGDAGQGKTTLCKKIVSTWCKVHSNIENVPDTEYQFLKSFDLLFYLPLRNNKLSDVIDMIKTDIVRKHLHDDLEEFLEKESEKCLIILDGLDEWLPSEDCKVKVPYIDPREKFTILITSRPWKLEILRLKTSEIGQYVELNGIKDDDLIEAVVNLLNNKSAKKRIGKHFKYTAESVCSLNETYMKGKHFKYTAESVCSLNETYMKVKCLAEVPIILTQMVCMWYDDEEFGNTRAEIYKKMLDYLFQVADKRYQETRDSAWMEQQWSSNTQLVNVFKGFTFCETYSEILFKLSNLANHTLFNKERVNSLVFPHSVTKIYELAENDVKFCLFVGILSQTNSPCKVSLQYKSISFLHKTFQEFLAALYIVFGGNDRNFTEMLDKLKSLDDVFEMSQVLIFLSGLRPNLLGDISHHIAQLTDKDDRVLQKRNSIYQWNGITNRLQDIIYECICEVPEHSILDIKVELHDLEIYDDMREDGILEKIIPYLNLKNVKSWDVPSKDRTKLNDLVKFGMGIESQEDIDYMTRTVERCASSLTCLSVTSRNRNMESRIVNIYNFLTALKKVSHLTCVSLCLVFFTHSDIENLGTTLSNRTQLKEIKLQGIRCTTCQRGHCNYKIDLSHHKLLQYLNIKSLDGVIVLSNEVPVERCQIDCVKCAGSILDTLKSSTNLHELFVTSGDSKLLYHTNSITSSTTTVQDDEREVHPTPLCLSKVLIDVIPTLKNLRRLFLYSIDFKDDILRLYPENTSLDTVGISSSTMTLQCLQGFIDSLPKTQVYVSIDDVSIFPQEDMYTALKYITDRYQMTSPHRPITIDGKLTLDLNSPY